MMDRVQVAPCTVTGCAPHWAGLIFLACCSQARPDCFLLLSAATTRSTTRCRCAAHLR